MLRTSGFVDDVIFSHTGLMVHYIPKRIEHVKCNSRDSNQILLSDKDQQVLIMSCAQVVKPAINDCPVE